MEFTPEQEGAISAVIDWFDLGDAHFDQPVFRLFGYAGTGKTTIAKEIAERINGTVIFAAFTGKAALVLNSKGCYGARTIHSLIYLPRPKCAEALRQLREKIDRLREEEADEEQIEQTRLLYRMERENLKKPAFVLNPESELRDAALLIVDEVSMVDDRIAEDLMSFGTPILALGDPAQLPPVRGCGYFTQAKPDYLLTEIHRQAADSPILGMATAVRQGRSLRYREEGDALVVPKGQLNAAALCKYDQIICGKNVTRRTINRHIRSELGFDNPLPQIGDRIVCLRNDSKTGLLNGSQWDVSGVEDDPEDPDDKILLTIAPASEDDAYTFTVTAHKHYFLGTEEEIPHYEISKAQCFDYAYALTCHKAQGSQWDRVVIVNKSGCFRQDANRWLYTALTRAAEKVVVIQ